MRDERLRRLGEFAYGLTPQKRQPFEAQGAQDRRIPNYLMSTEALVFSHSIRIVQVLPF